MRAEEEREKERAPQYGGRSDRQRERESSRGPQPDDGRVGGPMETKRTEGSVRRSLCRWASPVPSERCSVEGKVSQSPAFQGGRTYRCAYARVSPFGSFFSLGFDCSGDYREQVIVMRNRVRRVRDRSR